MNLAPSLTVHPKPHNDEANCRWGKRKFSKNKSVSYSTFSNGISLFGKTVTQCTGLAQQKLTFKQICSDFPASAQHLSDHTI